MTVLLGFIFATGVVAVVVCVCAWNDPGRAEMAGDSWDLSGRVVARPIGNWAQETAHHHCEPTLEAVATCRYCGSVAHSTFLHASR